MNKLTLIGDVHGKFGRYKTILENLKNPSVQLGDMGVGFYYRRGDDLVAYANPPYDAMVNGGHRFERGNHDNPHVCQRHSQWIPDGTVENDVMFVGGAVSIDKDMRTEGLDYWPEEELSYEELQRIIDIYLVAKPRIMLTHECPESVAPAYPMHYAKDQFPSRTRQAFQVMFEMHQPQYWVHGHWHIRMFHEVNGTQFMCLEELGTVDLEV